jgi:hypothetical protein
MLSITIPAVADNQFSLGTGFDYSSGKYGNATETRILYIPVTARYESDKLTLKLTVPYISITGPGGVIQGMGRMGRPTTRTTQTANSGVGDVTASAGYNAYSGGALAFDLVGNVKLGTADAKVGLGTGENDYSAQIDGYYTLAQTTLFATVGYKKYGAPAGVTMNNVRYNTLGFSQKLGRTTSAGAMLYSSQSPTAAGTASRDATLYISQKMSTTLKVQAYVLKGFTSGSPDSGGGLMLTGYF